MPTIVDYELGGCVMIRVFHKALNLRIERFPYRRLIPTDPALAIYLKGDQTYDDGIWRVKLYTQTGRGRGFGRRGSSEVSEMVSITYHGNKVTKGHQTNLRMFFSAGILQVGLEDAGTTGNVSTKVAAKGTEYERALFDRFKIDHYTFDNPNGIYEFRPSEYDMFLRVLTDGTVTCRAGSETYVNPTADDYESIEACTKVSYTVEDATWAVVCSFDPDGDGTECKVTLITESDDLSATMQNLEEFLGLQENMPTFDEIAKVYGWPPVTR